MCVKVSKPLCCKTSLLFLEAVAETLGEDGGDREVDVAVVVPELLLARLAREAHGHHVRHVALLQVPGGGGGGGGLAAAGRLAGVHAALRCRSEPGTYC